MKKLLFLFLLFFISQNNIYCQKIDCGFCKGSGLIQKRDWIVCSNCKTWPQSYRNKVPCNVCKDNRGYYSAYYNEKCTYCKGSGRDSYEENLQKYIQKLKDNGSNYSNGWEIGPCLGEINFCHASKAIEYLEGDWTILDEYQKNLDYDGNRNYSVLYGKEIWLGEMFSEAKKLDNQCYQWDGFSSKSRYFYPLRNINKAFDLNGNYIKHKNFQNIIDKVDSHFKNLDKLRKGNELVGEEVQKQKTAKTDHSAFNKTNIKVTERSGIIKFTVNENSNIDIMNMFLTNNDKQVLGIKTWSFISFVIAQTDSESFITKIRIQDKNGMFLLLTNEDAEKFEIAKRFIQTMKEKII